MLDGDSSGLEVCDLMGWAVSMGFAVTLPDVAEVLVFITVGRLHVPLRAGSCVLQASVFEGTV